MVSVSSEEHSAIRCEYFCRAAGPGVGHISEFREEKESYALHTDS